MISDGLIKLPSWADGSWDIATCEGKDVPGLVRVEVKRGPKWDRKEASGQSGEKATFKGFRGADVSIRVRMWTPDQEAAFEVDILPLIDPQPGKESPKGVAFLHPALAKRKVDAVLVEDLAGPNLDEEGKWVEYEIQAFEYRKPVPQQGSPGKPGQTPCQQAKASYDAEVATATALSKQFQAKAADVAWLASPEAEQASRDLQAANDRARHWADLMRENGCDKEQTPGSQAQSGGLPPP